MKKIFAKIESFYFGILRKLIGKRIVMVNVTMKAGTVHIPADGHAYIYDCSFEGPRDGALFVVNTEDVCRGDAS